MHVYPAPEQTTSFGPGTHAIDPRYMKSVKWASIPKFMEIQKSFATCVAASIWELAIGSVFYRVELRLFRTRYLGRLVAIAVIATMRIKEQIKGDKEGFRMAGEPKIENRYRGDG